jgi:hypothetical protein
LDVTSTWTPIGTFPEEKKRIIEVVEPRKTVQTEKKAIEKPTVPKEKKAPAKEAPKLPEAKRSQIGLLG